MSRHDGIPGAVERQGSLIGRLSRIETDHPHGRRNQARSRPDHIRFPVRASRALEYLEASEWRQSGVRFPRHQNGGHCKRHTGTGVRDFPADLCRRNLAAKAMGRADGMGLRGLCARQSRTVYAQNSRKVAVVCLRSGLCRDRARRFVGFRDPAHAPQSAPGLKRNVALTCSTIASRRTPISQGATQSALGPSIAAGAARLRVAAAMLAMTPVWQIRAAE